ncbi:MAG: DsbC family protein [Thermodesulfobacteriota bacterium]|nr:MAG: DsbC family protein [Thermodesulfobacteriota bacterium]
MKRIKVLALVSALAIAASYAPGAGAFESKGGNCAECHTLSNDEASKLLKADKFKAQVKEVRLSPVKGLWEVELVQGEKVIIVHVDFAKKTLIEGKLTELAELGEPKPLRKVDLKDVSLEKAVVMGDPKAEKKVVVFSDPDCPYCARLHEELKKINAERKDIAFYIKMYPLAIHPNAYEKSKAIACKKSIKLLEDAFAGKKLPKPDCETQEVDNNIRLAEGLGINGTPALVMPDGRLFPGYAPADVLIGVIDNRKN